jgi:hypothetical protein
VNVWRPHATPRHPRDNMDRVNFRRLTRHTSVTRPAMPKRSRLSAVARLKRKKIAAIAPLTRSQRLTQSSLVHDCGIASVCLPVCLSLSLSPLSFCMCVRVSAKVGANTKRAFARSTSRVHLWRRRGARAVVRQLWAASLGPCHRGSIIRHRRSKRHRRVIRACHPAAMSRRSRPRHTATCHTRGPPW